MKKDYGVFPKIFAYTMFLLLLMCLAAVFLFARQFLSFYQAEQRRQLSLSFEPMLEAIANQNKTSMEILETARVFSANNQSFKFVIQDGNGNTLFSTLGAARMESGTIGEEIRIRFMGMTRNQGDNSGNVYVLTGYNSGAGVINYGDLVKRSLLALGFMLIIAIFGAILFAKKVTKPLEDEIIRERIMEENQRLFFSAASHELKTPIAAARALVEGMIAGVGEYRDHHKYLLECMKTLDSQAALVSEILEIVKFSGEEAEPQALTFDLAELGATVLSEHRPLAELRGLAIQGEFPCLIIRTDRGLLQRVLSNVIANAVQNTPEGGVIHIRTDTAKHTRLCIVNTGANIPEEMISKIFEPFYRLDAARFKSKHGIHSGLGLTIVKKALERMNLSFALENTPEGVLFWMDLPVSGDSEKTSGKLQAESSNNTD